MYRLAITWPVYTPGSDLRVEKFVYRLVRVQPDAQQRWTKYLSSLLAFSLVSPLVRYALLLLQVNAPEPWGHKGMTAALAFNTAISFTTNTSWQNTPANPPSAISGWSPGSVSRPSPAPSVCVPVALSRGLIATQNGELGNFWVDLVRRGALRRPFRLAGRRCNKRDDGVRGSHPPDAGLPTDSVALGIDEGEHQASLIDNPGRWRRQRGVKVRRGCVKRTLKTWRTSFVLRHRRIVARW